MSKLTIGLMAGAVLTSAAALTVVAVSGAGTSGHEGTVAAEATPLSTSSPATGAPAGVRNPSHGQGVAAQRAAGADPKANSGSASKPAKASEVKAIRSVTLTFPVSATNVGANVTGTIQVADTAAGVTTPVSGAAVALQQKRGTAFVTVADGVTDDTGTFAVAFTSKANTTWRAELTPEVGTKKYSSPLTTIATTTVTWAARPDLAVVHGLATSYSFRISPSTTLLGHLEIANSKKPTKWVALPGVAAAPGGVIVQSERFPLAGTWLIRGATAANTINGAGYTTILSVAVS